MGLPIESIKGKIQKESMKEIESRISIVPGFN